MKPKFNFANLLGGTKSDAKPAATPASEAGSEPDSATANPAPAAGNDTAGDQPTPSKASAAPDKTREDQPSAALKAAKAKAGDDAATVLIAHGEARATARIGEILSSDAASGRIEQALHLAINHDMEAAAAIDLLKTLPVAAQKADARAGGASQFAAALDRHGATNPGAGTTGSGAGTDAGADASLLDFVKAKHADAA